MPIPPSTLDQQQILQGAYDEAAQAIRVETVGGGGGTNVNIHDSAGSSVTVGQKPMAQSLPVAIASDQSAVPVSAASLPLPTGASTSANQTTGNASLASIDGKLNSLGQKASAASVPVVIASDQSTVPVSGTVTAVESHSAVLPPTRNDYLITPVTTAAYVQLIASTSALARIVEIFDSSGQTMVIAFGAAASEIDQFLVFPGGNGRITINVPAATRVSIKAVSANATVGEIDINLYS